MPLPAPPSRPGSDADRPSRGPASRLAVLLAVLLLPTGSLLSGCFGDGDQPAPEPSVAASSSNAPDAAPHLRLRTRVSRVAGALAPKQRRTLTQAADGLVAAYLQAAFLSDGHRVRTPFPGFTPGTQRLARRDADVLTARRLRGRPVGVAHATASVSAVAEKRRAVGATAQVSVDLPVAEAGRTRTVHVDGRLMLTPTDRGWRIFGYHVASSAARASSAGEPSGPGRKAGR